MNTENQNIEKWAKWNDKMIEKYHGEGTLFESKNPLLRWFERYRVKTIIRLAKIKTNDNILDLGCGEGFLISVIKKYNKITGVDISRVALEKAKNRLKTKKNVELIFGDAHHLNFENKSYDKIVCSEVLEHVPEPKKVLTEVYRILKDDGILVISVPDEKRIENIMKFIKFFKFDKFLHAARKQETYEWHLHRFNEKMMKEVCAGLFLIKKIKRVPPIIGYRFVVQLRKLS